MLLVIPMVSACSCLHFVKSTSGNFNTRVYECADSSCNTLTKLVYSHYGNPNFFCLPKTNTEQYFLEFDFQEGKTPQIYKIKVRDGFKPYFYYWHHYHWFYNYHNWYEYHLGEYYRVITFTKADDLVSAINLFSLSSESVNVGEPVTISTTVSSGFSLPAGITNIPAELKVIYSTNVTVILYINGVAVQQQIINIPAGETADVTFTYIPISPGTEQIQIGTNFDSDIQCEDGCTETISNPIQLIVNPIIPVNTAPVLNSIGNKTVNAWNALIFTVFATDIDNDILTYSSSALPSGAVFDSNSGLFLWVPTATQNGSYNLIFSVSDGDLTDSEVISIMVIASGSNNQTNDTTAPIITINSPLNITYPNNNINFSITLSEPGTAMIELDNQTYQMKSSSQVDWYLGYLDNLVILSGCSHKVRYTATDLAGNTATSPYVYFSIAFQGCPGYNNQSNNTHDPSIHVHNGGGTSPSSTLNTNLPLLKLSVNENNIGIFRVIIKNKGETNEDGFITLRIDELKFREMKEFDVSRKSEETIIFYIPVTQNKDSLKIKITLDYNGNSEDFYYTLNVEGTEESNEITFTPSNTQTSGNIVGITGNVVSGSGTGTNNNENLTYSIFILLLLVAICVVLILISKRKKD